MNASIVINTLNGNQKHLVEAVKSCLNQNGVNIQLIVSTVKGDPSIKTLKGYKIDLVINDRSGIYYQLNNGLKRIKYEWWSYISGNDVMLSNKMKEEISMCVKHKKKICYSNYNVMDHNMNYIKTNTFHKYSFAKHLEGNFVNDAATVHKSLLDKYGTLSEEFDNLGYWDFWLKIGKEHPDYFIYNPMPVFNYRLSDNSRHVKRKNNPAWKARELKDRRAMLSRHGSLRGKYAKI